MVTPTDRMPEGPSEHWPDHVEDAFGDDLPHLIHVDRDVATQVMAKAVVRGRPIHPYLISRLSGGWRGPPPSGVLI
jgi:hypothetical protein